MWKIVVLCACVGGLCASQSLALTLDDVIELSQAGLSDGVIKGQIDAEGKVFILSTSDILRLKEAGVSDEVIEHLIRTRARRLENQREEQPTEVRHERRIVVEELVPVVRTTVRRYYTPTVVIHRSYYYPPPPVILTDWGLTPILPRPRPLFGAGLLTAPPTVRYVGTCSRPVGRPVYRPTCPPPRAHSYIHQCGVYVRIRGR